MQFINVSQFYETVLCLSLPLLFIQRFILICMDLSKKYSKYRENFYENEFAFTQEYQFQPEPELNKMPDESGVKDEMLEKNQEAQPKSGQIKAQSRRSSVYSEINVNVSQSQNTDNLRRSSKISIDLQTDRELVNSQSPRKSFVKPIKPEQPQTERNENNEKKQEKSLKLQAKNIKEQNKQEEIKEDNKSEENQEKDENKDEDKDQEKDQGKDDEVKERENKAQKQQIKSQDEAEKTDAKKVEAEEQIKNPTPAKSQEKMGQQRKSLRISQTNLEKAPQEQLSQNINKDEFIQKRVSEYTQNNRWSSMSQKRASALQRKQTQLDKINLGMEEKDPERQKPIQQIILTEQEQLQREELVRIRLKYCRRIDDAFNEYVPIIMSVIVVGFVTKSIYIFSMVCFFGFAFTSLLFNYAHLLQKLEDSLDSKSIFARANHLLSSLFIFALFVSYWIASQFNID